MASSLLTHGWAFRRESDTGFTPVDLPHDAMFAEPRSAAAPAWAHGAYFPGGRYRYRRTITALPEWQGKEVSVRFEGVYRHSRVLLDGRDLGGAVSGYRELEVRLDPHLATGAEQALEVLVDNAETPSSRWYTGSGIYRPVHLEVRDPIHVVPGGVGVVTRLEAPAARVRIDVAIANPDLADVVLHASLRRRGAVAAAASTTVDGVAAVLELLVERPDLWSADDPARYDLELVLVAGGLERDRVRHLVGLRTIELDPARGLLVNGVVETLRGANVHHDNGVVGATTLPAAEHRRVRLLKEAGFNALRSAHNPASRALLDACDEQGVYVIDEAFDGWYDHKTEHDEAERFATIWQDELRSMVAKDRARPSVLLYSIGNENSEALTPAGRRTAAEMVAELRRLDPSRPVTIGVNLVAAAFAGLADGHRKDPDVDGARSAPDMTSTALNAISNRFGLLMARFPRLRAADRATRDLFGLVDVAGYNYGSARYGIDARLHPERLIVGTETMPGDLARNRALVERIPSLVGDFVWAGWDYLGEAGAGTWAYGTRRSPFMKPYPHLVSGMGVFDLTGVPGAAVLLARAAWGLLDAPGVAVRPLDVPSGPVARTAWRSTDGVESWSWAGHEGERAELEVYSADDEVEVRINGRSLGRRPAGPAHGFLARFRDVYEPGVVEAVGYRAGRATSRSELRTAGTPRLRLVAEGDLGSGPLDAVHLRVELADDDGRIDTAAQDVVTVEVDGPATLAGFGSAAPATEESFTDAVHTTYRGRALAVVRSTGTAGRIVVRATSREHGSAAHTFASAEADTRGRRP